MIINPSNAVNYKQIVKDKSGWLKSNWKPIEDHCNSKWEGMDGGLDDDGILFNPKVICGQWLSLAIMNLLLSVCRFVCDKDIIWSRHTVVFTFLTLNRWTNTANVLLSSQLSQVVLLLTWIWKKATSFSKSQLFIKYYLFILINSLILLFYI